MTHFIEDCPTCGHWTKDGQCDLTLLPYEDKEFTESQIELIKESIEEFGYCGSVATKEQIAHDEFLFQKGFDDAKAEKERTA